MSYLITGAILGLCFFIVPLWAYRRGLRDGLAINQGKTIEPIQTPIQAVQSHVERKHEAQTAKEQQDKFTAGLANILSYDGSKQKDGET